MLWRGNNIVLVNIDLNNSMPSSNLDFFFKSDYALQKYRGLLILSIFAGYFLFPRLWLRKFKTRTKKKSINCLVVFELIQNICCSTVLWICIKIIHVLLSHTKNQSHLFLLYCSINTWGLDTDPLTPYLDHKPKMFRWHIVKSNFLNGRHW